MRSKRWAWLVGFAVVGGLLGAALLSPGGPERLGAALGHGIRSGPIPNSPDALRRLSLIAGDVDVVPVSVAAAAPEYPVDLADLEERLPDNSYWRLSSPTEDPVLLHQRELWRAETNRVYGRIAAGDATEAEIDAYYAEAQRISTDYVALAKLVLDDFGDQLPERDRGLFELAAKMHAGRLTELPRRLAEAHERRRQQEQRRAAWR